MNFEDIERNSAFEISRVRTKYQLNRAFPELEEPYQQTPFPL